MNVQMIDYIYGGIRLQMNEWSIYGDMNVQMND